MAYQIVLTTKLLTECIDRVTDWEKALRLPEPSDTFVYRPLNIEELLQPVNKRSQETDNLYFEEVHEGAKTPPLDTKLVSIGLETPPVKLKRVARIKKHHAKAHSSREAMVDNMFKKTTLQLQPDSERSESI